MAGSVGKSIPRLDGYEKVTGRAKYIDDINMPGCWYGVVVRSPIPYGKIEKINFDSAFDWGKVVTCDYRDIPGQNATIFLTEDQPILAEELVRHVGEAVVLVAAPTRELAEEAAKHVKIEYEELKPILSIEESQSKNTVIWGEDNIQSKYHIIKGDIEKGFKEADFIIEGEYRTGFQEHIYLEPQGAAAIPRDDGGLKILASAQCPFYVLKTLKAVLKLDESKINVVQTTMGGAFGGKEDYPSLMAAYVALLALKSEKSVKMIYRRDEDIIVTTKRHPSIVTHKTGVKKNGTITAIEIDVKLEGGAYSTMSPVVLSRAVIHAAGVYKCDNTESKAACYATNNVPTGAFRGFGAPQVFFALESHMDRVAEKVGMDPFTFRFQNCVHVGDTLSTTQLLKESVAAEECLTKAARSTHFLKKWMENSADTENSQNIRKGIGLSLYMHGGAFTGSGEAVMKTEAGLRLEEDGHISILTGCTDMGQGAFTVLPQIAADALAVPVELVSCVTPDTAVVPDSGPTVASRTTMIIGSVMELCAREFRDKILDFIGEKNRERQFKADDFRSVAEKYLKEKGELKVIKRYKLPPGIKWDPEKHIGDAYPSYSWAADVAEVTVDMDTFEVSVDKITVAVDVGKAVNPILLEGQIEGGTLQAVGYGLMEDSIYDNGRPVTDRMQTYIVPTVADTPKWRIEIVEEPFSGGPYGVKGVGELPLDGGAPAIANAIYNATGIRVIDLPITPEKLYSSSRNQCLE